MQEITQKGSFFSMTHTLEYTENSKRTLQLAVVKQHYQQKMTLDRKLYDSFFVNKHVICTSQTNIPYIYISFG